MRVLPRYFTSSPAKVGYARWSILRQGKYSSVRTFLRRTRDVNDLPRLASAAPLQATLLVARNTVKIVIVARRIALAVEHHLETSALRLLEHAPPREYRR
jgi:hypothetical protein